MLPSKGFLCMRSALFVNDYATPWFAALQMHSSLRGHHPPESPVTMPLQCVVMLGGGARGISPSRKIPHNSSTYENILAFLHLASLPYGAFLQGKVGERGACCGGAGVQPSHRSAT